MGAAAQLANPFCETRLAEGLARWKRNLRGEAFVLGLLVPGHAFLLPTVYYLIWLGKETGVSVNELKEIVCL